MISDEFHLSGTFPTRNEVDRREMDDRNGTLLGQYRTYHRARVGTRNAAERMAEILPNDPRIAEMWNLNGYMNLFFAENYCSGVPFSETPNEGDIVYGEQQTTEQIYNAAVASFGSAAQAAGGSTDQSYLAAIGLARTRLNQGDHAGAASAAATVPADWAYYVRSKAGGAFGQRNAVFELNQRQRRWSISDMEGENGVAFRSAPDSRVPWEDSGGPGFDQETPLFHQLKYDSEESDVVLASGLEAQLIKAEAELSAGGPWLATLNALRAGAGLDALEDPGDRDGRVRMLFEERARWLFGTGHRHGDLRRMVRQYGYTQDQVFPTGTFFKGGAYGTDVNFPIPFEEHENEALSGLEGQSLCLNRAA
ncbi:MAG: RagB/SusD family nutrient uptake outer membrane protein [Gemmatimonadetes bacterium]|nr:RagB/SusD family nutrient uptake outer membrane protein [Gemmatimonadota bacterium]